MSGNGKAADLLKHIALSRHKIVRLKDAGVAAAFITAIAMLLFVAGYVIVRIEGDRVHREKWQDYNDCGWA